MWRPGKTIVRREVVQGRPRVAVPGVVVADDPGLLASCVAPSWTPGPLGDGWDVV